MNMDTLTLAMPQVQRTRQTQASPCILVIGIGARHKHDEQAGLYVAHRIREEIGGTSGRAIQVIDETKDVLDLMEMWQTQTAEVVFAIDAVVDGRGPGTPGAIHRFEVCPPTGCEDSIPGNILFSSRELGLADVVHLAESLGKLPARLIIYGIEAEHFEPGEGLSLPVLAAAEQIAREILDFILSARSAQESSFGVALRIFTGL